VRRDAAQQLRATKIVKRQIARRDRAGNRGVDQEIVAAKRRKGTKIIYHGNIFSSLTPEAGGPLAKTCRQALRAPRSEPSHRRFNLFVGWPAKVFKRRRIPSAACPATKYFGVEGAEFGSPLCTDAAAAEALCKAGRPRMVVGSGHFTWNRVCRVWRNGGRMGGFARDGIGDAAGSCGQPLVLSPAHEATRPERSVRGSC